MINLFHCFCHFRLNIQTNVDTEFSVAELRATDNQCSIIGQSRLQVGLISDHQSNLTSGIANLTQFASKIISMSPDSCLIGKLNFRPHRLLFGCIIYRLRIEAVLSVDIWRVIMGMLLAQVLSRQKLHS